MFDIVILTYACFFCCLFVFRQLVLEQIIDVSLRGNGAAPLC